MVELTMRAGNRASRLYERVGFACVAEARHYVIAGDTLERLAAPAAKPAERMVWELRGRSRDPPHFFASIFFIMSRAGGKFGAIVSALRVSVSAAARLPLASRAPARLT